MALVLVGDEDDPGGVSSSYWASARLSRRATLLLLGERSTSGLLTRSSSPKLLGRRKGPSEWVSFTDFEAVLDGEALDGTDA